MWFIMEKVPWLNVPALLKVSLNREFLELCNIFYLSRYIVLAEIKDFLNRVL